MNITLIDDSNPFTSKERENLWNQGVDLDDWDYALIVPIEALKTEEYRGGDDKMKTRFLPHNFHLELMTQNACYTSWYKAHFRDKEVGIGIVYR